MKINLFKKRKERVIKYEDLIKELRKNLSIFKGLEVYY